MTEPLIVDPERLTSASIILGEAAGNIPVELPKFAVSGTDPLSMAIAAGAAKVEAPMAALPGIKAEATTVAQKVGVAAQKYSTTDQMLAEKAKQLRFAPAETGPNSGDQPTPSRSITDQILSNLTAGPGGDQKPDPDTLLGHLAAKSHPSATDTLLGNMTAQSPTNDATGTLLNNMAGRALGNDGARAGLSDIGKSFAGDKGDWILGLSSAKTSQIADGVAELTRGGAPENTLVAKAVEEVKLFGTEIKGSRIGGAAALLFSGAAFAKDTGQDHMPPVHAFVREGAALMVGTAFSAPLDVTVIGAPAGAALGIFMGNAAAKTMDIFYYMGQGVADAGGPGAVMKVARWGHPPV